MRAFLSVRYDRHSDPLGTGMQPPTAFARECESADALHEAQRVDLYARGPLWQTDWTDTRSVVECPGWGREDNRTGVASYESRQALAVALGDVLPVLDAMEAEARS